MPVLLLSLAVMLSASGPSVALQKKISVRQTTASPSFHPVQYPVVMDRGNLVNIGRGLFKEQDVFYFFDTRSLQQFKVKAPIAGFLESNLETFPKARGAGWPKYATNRLLFYATIDKRAGILFNDTEGFVRRLFFLLWDLETNTISRFDELGTGNLRGRWMDVLPLGYDPELRQGIVRMLILEKATSNMPATVKLMTLGTAKPRVIATVELRRHLKDPPYFDYGLRRAMLVEYGENPLKGPKPTGYLIDLDRGKVVQCRIPVVAYGVAFGPGGKKVYVNSYQTGEVWAIDGRSGKRLSKRKVMRGGWALGFVAPDKLLMLNGRGFHFVNPKTLKRTKFLPYRNLGPAPHLIERSFIRPGRAYVWKSWVLHVIDVLRIPR
jgi:hypothetical protein